MPAGSALLFWHHIAMSFMPVQALPDWLAELQITNLDVSFCKGCNIDVVSSMTSLQVLCLQVRYSMWVWVLRSHMLPSRNGMHQSADHSGALAGASSLCGPC